MPNSAAAGVPKPDLEGLCISRHAQILSNSGNLWNHVVEVAYTRGTKHLKQYFGNSISGTSQEEVGTPRPERLDGLQHVSTADRIFGEHKAPELR